MPGIFVQTLAFASITTAIGDRRRHDQGPDRPLPLAADGPLGRAQRPHVRRRRSTTPASCVVLMLTGLASAGGCTRQPRRLRCSRSRCCSSSPTRWRGSASCSGLRRADRRGGAAARLPRHLPDHVPLERLRADRDAARRAAADRRVEPGQRARRSATRELFGNPNPYVVWLVPGRAPDPALVRSGPSGCSSCSRRSRSAATARSTADAARLPSRPAWTSTSLPSRSRRSHPSSRRAPAAATSARSCALAAARNHAARYVARHVARDLRVLLQPAQRVLVPAPPVGDVDPQRVPGGDELAVARASRTPSSIWNSYASARRAPPTRASDSPSSHSSWVAIATREPPSRSASRHATKRARTTSDVLERDRTRARRRSPCRAARSAGGRRASAMSSSVRWR